MTNLKNFRPVTQKFVTKMDTLLTANGYSMKITEAGRGVEWNKGNPCEGKTKQFYFTDFDSTFVEDDDMFFSMTNFTGWTEGGTQADFDFLYESVTAVLINRKSGRSVREQNPARLSNRKVC